MNEHAAESDSGRGHVTTDPKCIRHQPPRNRWQHWRFDRGRGRACPICCFKHGAALALDSLPIRQRDEYVAQVIRFLIERGYTITAPGGAAPRPIPPGVDQ